MNALNDISDPTLLSVLEQLDDRLRRIEDRLNLPSPSPEAGAPSAAPLSHDTSEGLEFRIGRIWLPRIGVAVLTLGVIFLLTLPLDALPAGVANALGFLLTAVLFASSRIWRTSLPEFSRYLQGGAMLLFYVSVMRLHFFSADPLIGSLTAAFLLLIAVVLLNLVISVRSASVALTGLNLGLGYFTALLSPNDYIVLGLILGLSFVTTTIALRRKRSGLAAIGIIYAFFTHFLWSISNPLFGGAVEIRTEPFANLFFLLAWMLTFGIANLQLTRREDENSMIVVTSFFNASLPYILLMFLTVTAFTASFAAIHTLAAVLLLSLAIGTWKSADGRYSTFFYAMAGNLALSAAIFQRFAIPDNFLWLCLQSFLVISLAVWFRSRIIVVANFIIFLGIVLAYLVMTDAVNAVGLVFGFVALLSARIMNWQRDRLELEADMLRSAYLLTALFIFPYTLYNLLPGGWVSLSWVAVSAMYYLLSRLLHNFKYRWMALTTLLMAVVHLMIVGTTSFEPVYRIVSFIVLGIVLLGVSLWYFKSAGKTATPDEDRPADPPAAA